MPDSPKKPEILEKSEAEEFIKAAIDEKKKVSYTTIKKSYGKKNVYIDIPSHIKEWNAKKYGYQLTAQKNVIFIRIIPKTKYSTHTLTNEELERRLLIYKIKDINLSELVKLIENPFDVLERKGKIVRLSEEAIRKNIHFVMSHYENPEESDSKDFLIDDVFGI